MQRLIRDIRNELDNHFARSAWDRGVRDFAVDMLNSYLERRNLSIWDEQTRIGRITEEDLLDGAKNWNQYSHDGNYLIYNQDICRALCNQRDQKRTQDGKLPPNDQEDWLDFQARALRQAAQMVVEAVNRREKGS